MNKLNLLFTLSSINVLLVTVERFSFTTKILLQPYSFLRLHEVFQMTIIILFTVLLPFLMLKEVSLNFEGLKKKSGLILGLIFISGVYFYATGNGLHEVSSFNFNFFCDVNNFSGDLCGSMFFNDYYTGNIYYFIGGLLMIVPLLLFERKNSSEKFNSKDMKILIANAIVYAFAIFAYSGFDRVLVGLIYSVIVSIFALYIFWPIRKSYSKYPVITYTTLTYLLGTVAAIAVRVF